MKTIPLAGLRPIRQTLPLVAVVMLAACTTSSQTTSRNNSSGQPIMATYNCGDGGQLSVENDSASVTIIDPDGNSVDLPAAPPTQRSRYGQEGYALVLDGREALYMKSGKTPLTCRR